MAISIASSRSLTIKQTVSEGDRLETDQFTVNDRPAWVNSAGAAGITVQWNDRRPLNTTSENLDLAGGVNNAFGPVTFTKPKKFYARNTGSSGNLKIGEAITNSWNTLFLGAIILPPGASVDLECADAAGWPVTPGTGDLLKVEHTGNGSYDMAIAGEGTQG